MSVILILFGVILLSLAESAAKILGLLGLVLGLWRLIVCLRSNKSWWR